MNGRKIRPPLHCAGLDDVLVSVQPLRDRVANFADLLDADPDDPEWWHCHGGGAVVTRARQKEDSPSEGEADKVREIQFSRARLPRTMFRVKLTDVRCFAETANPVEILPITFLVGENSAGKTTFLAGSRLLFENFLRIPQNPFNKDPYYLGGFDQIAHYR
jgi:hypothetical protein